MIRQDEPMLEILGSQNYSWLSQCELKDIL